jgi:hypothetical protein
MRRTGGLIGLILISACSQPPNEPKPSEADKKAAYQAYAACLYSNAVALDDGRSDASTIGMAVRSACRSDYMKTVRIEIQGKGPDYARGFLETAQKADLEIATTAVLKVRSGSTLSSGPSVKQ